jgi:RNA polymerase sigma factor (sigma-70 family)
VSLAGPLLRLRSDDQLVALFRAGHDEAFGTIHDRYRARLFAYARQMLGGSRSDAEDVLQDVFLRAYNALRADGRPVALRAWLYRVAHNRCIDQLRRPAPPAEDIYDINRGVASDLLAEAERREDLRRLIADVRALPEQQRSALLMREMEGLSYNELSDALGVTVPAIKSLLVRARVGLVEAVEARDTACVEIREDLASAFDRGVRPSGRSRRHLRECAGCREYRGALRGVEKTLNGLAPSSGPLTVLAKVLGIGGAGSGAAAGGGAMAVGGGTAGAGGAVAATATKVVAVVAAAAVVGGGAAKVEQQVDHHRAPAAGPAVTRVPPAAARITPRDPDLAVRHAAAAGAGAHAPRPAAEPATPAPGVAHLTAGAVAPADSSTGTHETTAEPTTGGVQAPDDTTPAASADAPAADGGTGDPATATAGQGATSGAQSTTADAPATGTTSAGTTSSSTTSSSTAAAGTGGSATSTTTTTASGGPSGTVSPTSGGPVAQGAAAPPAG